MGIRDNQLSRYGTVAKTVPGNPLGKVFFVLPSTSSLLGDFQQEFPVDSDGVARVHTTIAAAISNTVSSRGDVVYIAPGTYTITSALVPKAHTSFIAMQKTNPRVPTVTITGNIADLIQIDVDGTYWDGIEIKASGATADNLVDIADSAAVSGVTFNDCVFNGNDQTSVDGINLTDAANATTGLVVRGCLFRDLTGTPIDVGVLGMPYASITNNQFAIDVNSGTGINLADTTAFATGKGYVIADNLFTGFAATGDEICITIAGTENTTGAGIITRNMFAYFNTTAAITQDKLSRSEVNNYQGDAATGGTIVYPGT